MSQPITTYEQAEQAISENRGTCRRAAPDLPIYDGSDEPTTWEVVLFGEADPSLGHMGWGDTLPEATAQAYERLTRAAAPRESVEERENKALERIVAFGLKHDLVFQAQGEIGMGRPCVGFTKGNEYIGTAPYNMTTFDPIPGFNGDELMDLAPSDAYHKHPCLAVLVHDEDYREAVFQLDDWIQGLENLGVEVAEFRTGATGMQAMLTGAKGHALRIKAEG